MARVPNATLHDRGTRHGPMYVTGSSPPIALASTDASSTTMSHARATASAMPAPSALLSPSLHTATKHPTFRATSFASSTSMSAQCGSTLACMTSSGKHTLDSSAVRSTAAHARRNSSSPRAARHFVPPICASASPTLAGNAETNTTRFALANVNKKSEYSSTNARRAPTHASLLICTTTTRFSAPSLARVTPLYTSNAHASDPLGARA
mmetsp:Transcript_1060/g.3901  ORF Transcript_1060/g.3901 Transcript_1060/m.3901 type:complete len:209 (-) Transcript_1060:293-919(-)